MATIDDITRHGCLLTPMAISIVASIALAPVTAVHGLVHARRLLVAGVAQVAGGVRIRHAVAPLSGTGKSGKALAAVPLDVGVVVALGIRVAVVGTVAFVHRGCAGCAVALVALKEKD